MTLEAPQAVIDWLLAGDVAVQYQARRDLLGEDDLSLRDRIASEGWGAAYLAARKPEGHWGEKYYFPKWTSTHYTLLDLKNLGIDPASPPIRESVDMVVRTERNPDGGMGPNLTSGGSDVCVTGMFLNYASYFGVAERDLHSVIDFLIGQHMGDGGFNCLSNRQGARHSSMHSTVSVLDGVNEYLRAGHSYRLEELEGVVRDSVEFLLLHRLFRSDRTGEVIKAEFLKLPYPWRWKFNILRGLDCLGALGVPWDNRMRDAVDVLLEKRRPDGRWNTNAALSGETHFIMEKAGKPGRWNTLIALRASRRLKFGA